MGHRAAALLIAMVASIGLGSVVAGLPLRDLVLPVAAIGSLAVAAATGQRRLLLAVSAGLYVLAVHLAYRGSVVP